MKTWIRVRLDKDNYHRLYDRMRRHDIIKFLGGVCVRCGFSDYRALQIDHKHGGGIHEHRALHRSAFYKRVREHPEDYQILCANCNWIKRWEENETSIKNS